ncbi:hypothetical protein CWE17_07150 [Synechococcus sp. BS56D]|nr:hypothetical protein CWE17_07150 [Synechococcus sp. BS56D]
MSSLIISKFLERFQSVDSGSTGLRILIIFFLLIFAYRYMPQQYYPFYIYLILTGVIIALFPSIARLNGLVSLPIILALTHHIPPTLPRKILYLFSFTAGLIFLFNPLVFPYVFGI